MKCQPDKWPHDSRIAVIRRPIGVCIDWVDGEFFNDSQRLIGDLARTAAIAQPNSSNGEV
jgi:hypothetical protein